MPKYKIVWDDGWEEDGIFDTEKAADEYAVYLRGCAREGAEILHMSNPGDMITMRKILSIQSIR